MDVVFAGHDQPGPAEVYSTQLERLNQAQALARRRDRLLGYSKVALFLLALAAAVLFIRRPLFLGFLVLPIGVFVVAAVVHEKVLTSLRMRERAIRFYERGLARVQDRWAGTGETGERFLDPLHPYARELDLFGRASLFELLCTARTRAGEETLAAWLLAPSDVEEVYARQAAVCDLKDRVKFREKLFSLGETVRLGVQTRALSDWGERSPLMSDRTTRIVTTTLAILWVLSIASWALWGLGSAAAVMTVVNLSWARRLHARLEKASASLENAADGLDLLAGVLALLECEHFTAPKLVALQAALETGAIGPSVAIRKLVRMTESLKSRRNMIARVRDVLVFWSAQVIFGAERWQQKFGPHIRVWLAAAGEFEALAALSGYAYEHPQDVFPEFAEDAPLFEAQALTHPLLPVSKAVRNDVKLSDALQLIVLSGPNMAGKSTFIRAIGVSTVMAQCGAPVRAARLRLSPVTVAASICILDSLSGGVSRFYAEIARIKVICDLSEGPRPVLFLLDELLSGTNSHDRLEGTHFVLRTLTEHGAIGIVSTHDLALTTIPGMMGARAANCHFEDRLENGKLIFDYRIKPGIVQTSNALELMRAIGLGVNPTR